MEDQEQRLSETPASLDASADIGSEGNAPLDDPNELSEKNIPALIMDVLDMMWAAQPYRHPEVAAKLNKLRAALDLPDGNYE